MNFINFVSVLSVVACRGSNMARAISQGRGSAVAESTSQIPNIVISSLPVLPPSRGSSLSLGDKVHLMPRHIAEPCMYFTPSIEIDYIRAKGTKTAGPRFI